MNPIHLFARQRILKSLTVFAVLVACLAGCNDTDEEQMSGNNASQSDEADQTNATESTEEETGQVTEEDTSSGEEGEESAPVPSASSGEEKESGDKDEKVDPEPSEQDEEETPTEQSAEEAEEQQEEQQSDEEAEEEQSAEEPVEEQPAEEAEEEQPAEEAEEEQPAEEPVEEQPAEEPVEEQPAEEAEASVPGAPTGLTKTSIGNGQVTVTWDAPTDTGSSPIVSYTVVRTLNGGADGTCVPTTTSCTLIDQFPPENVGTNTYTYRVFATNSVGDGPASSPITHLEETEAGVPGAPTGLTKTSIGNGQVTVTWDAPTDTGSSPIVSYTVVRTLNGGADGTCVPTTTSCTLIGHVPPQNAGTNTYTYRVFATNSVGNGPASSPITHLEETEASVPGAPTGLTKTSIGNGQVTVTWDAPTDTGSSPIVSYTVARTLQDGADGTCVPTTTSCTLIGHVPPQGAGTNIYTYTVYATNSEGDGPASSPITHLVRLAGAPTGLTKTSIGNGQVTVTWDALTDNNTGSSPIVSYTVARTLNGGADGTCVATTTSCTLIDQFPPQCGVGTNTYTYTVYATNSEVDGPASSSITHLEEADDGLPCAPTWKDTGTTGALFNYKFSGTWDAPTDTGSSPIISYTVVYTREGGTPQSTVKLQSLPEFLRMYYEIMLSVPSTQTFTVFATNSAGDGPLSAPVTIECFSNRSGGSDVTYCG